MMPTTSLPSAVLATLLGQGTRQIALDTPLREANLIVERFTAMEAVSRPFAIEIDCLSPSAHLDTVELARQEITLRLMLADGRYRAWHGFVVDCAAMGGDGGLARYRLTVAPWLERLRGRVDCYVYQDKTAQEIIEEVFRDYPAANFQFTVSQPLRRRSICAQYRESDFDFVQRLLAEEGLSYRFEHLQGEDDKPEGSQARHRLVVFDNDAERPPCPQASIRFHRADMTEETDTMTVWSTRHSIGPNAVTVSSWDYKTLTAPSAQANAAAVPGEWPTLESFDALGPYRYPDAATADRAAQLRMQAEESCFVRFDGAGTVRQLGAGQRFTLTEHFAGDGDEFVALSVRHEAANNLGADVAKLLGTTEVEAGGYRNTLEAVRADAPIVPRFRAKPTAPEGQTAIVIAEGETPLHTDRDHRVRVRFPWLRAPAPADQAGQSASFTDPGSDDLTQVTAWVRVAGAMAGPNWGTHHLPRVGTELLLTFLDGDIDRPLAAMQLHNEQDTPPWANDDKPLAAMLSGWHTRGLGGDGYNQWVVDDFKGRLRMRLASSAAQTQLNLGYLVAQGPQDAQRGPWRGTGAELRSDAWAVVRAGQGLLLSTTARPRATGTVMGMAEAIALLKGAQRTAERLSTAARTQTALPLAANEVFEPLMTMVEPEQDGRYEDTVNGQDAKQPDGKPVERFAEPLLVAEAPTSIAVSSQETTAVYSGRHLHGTVQSDWQLTAGKTIAMAAAQGVSLFVQRNGLKAVAANGPLSVQAHAGAMSILADKEVVVTSSNEAVEILAKNTVVLHGADSSIRLEGNAITFETPGVFEVKGAGHRFSGGAGKPAVLPALPIEALPPGTLLLDHRYHDDEGLAGAEYLVKFSDGTERRGVLDSQGKALLEEVPYGPATVSFGPMPGAFERKDKVPNPDHDPNPADTKLSQLVSKYLSSHDHSMNRS
ncbi:type VI secretion system Vgr family protein [Cupriavidus gilardii]|uniref:type VI secretion system Vgr family protein n=1 Tax=Cupriavidus gilardii TaxID=82541 RepID=UPI0021BF90AB|nr:type VI secretion system Vgr family protein [Cupriavidus gilardii]MCT9123121.1 type VI secretion system tip protein VgrG [Cupriavidus gilardii]